MNRTRKVAAAILDGLKRVWRRAIREPALVVSLILAVGNLIGHDFSDTATLVETVLILASGVVVRSRVQPVKKEQVAGETIWVSR